MTRTLGMLVGVLGLIAGCASAPRSTAKRSELNAQADSAIEEMVARDPSLRPLMRSAVGYVVFPSVAEGGFIVGGGGARGVVFEHGVPTGYAELSMASLGAQVGGQKYSEMILVRDPSALDRMRAGNFDFGAQASAIAVRAGAASQTTFGQSGVAVFVQPIGGAMINASLTGQRIKIVM